MQADIHAIKKCRTWSTEVDNERMWNSALADFKALINDELS